MRTLTVCCLAAIVLAPACGSKTLALPEHAVEVQTWRDKHEKDYREDYVSIAGLHVLAQGSQTVGSDKGNDVVLAAHVPATIGRLVVEQDTVTYEPAADVHATQGGAAITGPAALREPGKRSPEVIIGDVRLSIHPTGGRPALRVRDPNGAPARDFRGFSWFPIDTSFRVVGRFIPDEKPGKVPVVNTYNFVDNYNTEGVVEFELQGQKLRLRPFTTEPKRFYFVFRDASSGHETYETARFMYSDLREDGTTVLDFNEAYNPPCSFNRYTTCPIPLKENVLPVKILVGEQAYAGHLR